MCGHFIPDPDRLTLAHNLRSLFRPFDPRFRDVPVRPLSRTTVLTAGPRQAIAAKDLTFGYASQRYGRPSDIHNARSETVRDTPTFAPWTGHRVLIPASAWLQKHAVTRAEISLGGADGVRGLAFAGIWNPPAGWFVILTEPPRGAVVGIHHRQPIALPPDAQTAFLEGAPFENLPRETIRPLSHIRNHLPSRAAA